MADLAFTAAVFKATGTSTARTIPARLAEVHNVKDFGAKGDGVTDDWAAITAAYNWTVNVRRGTIFFPPGTYLVSQSIVLGGGSFIVTGVPGASIITGNFADYILKRDNPADTILNNNVIENLTVINQHATGGGIRMGDCVVGAIRNCVVTANQAISNAIDDTVSPLTSLEVTIDNCILSPGSNVAGSNGVMSVADGPILNCRIIGFETGMLLWGNEGAMNVLGCYFEQNSVGIEFGVSPEDVSSLAGSVTVAGCWFKNNGTAMKFSTGIANGLFCGIRIEASEAVTIGGSRPQYGIYISGGKATNSLFSGIIVTGQYDQYGVYLQGSGEGGGIGFCSYNAFSGVQSFNTSTHGGLPWRVPQGGGLAQFIECNLAATPAVFTIATLPIIIGGGIVSGSWAPKVIWELGTITPGSGYVDGFYSNVPLTGGSGTGAIAATIAVAGGQVVLIDGQFSGSAIVFYPPSGTNYVAGDTLSASNVNLGGSGSGFSVPVTVVKDTATVTTSSLNLSPLQSTSFTMNVNIQGITPSQYNGVYTGGVALATDWFAYGSVSNPGGNITVAGTVIVNVASDGIPNALEGDCYNVSDSNVSTWGATPSGSGSTHAKVRWSGTNWSVVGK